MNKISLINDSLYGDVIYDGELFQVPLSVLNGDTIQFANTMKAIKKHREVEKQLKLAKDFEYMSMMGISEQELDQMLAEAEAEWNEELKRQESQSTTMQDEIDKFWEEYTNSFDDSEVANVPLAASDELWAPVWRRPPEPTKPKCECGTLAIDKQAKPWHHAEYCPLYEKRQDK